MDLQDEPRADAIRVARQTGSGATDGSGARKSQNPKRFQYRHMNRHRQRDQEAGGPGCGTLDTRKRSWKAPDGSVVQKRPRPEARQPGPWTASGFDSSIQVVSPPVSDEGRSGHQYQLGADNEEYFEGAFNVLEASVSLPRCPPTASYDQPEFEYSLQPNISNSRSQLSSNDAQLEYHPVFQPDTASSFNMPYTTALDYSWLFNLEAATASGFGLTSAQAGFQNQNTYSRQDTENSSTPDMIPSQQAQNPTPESRDGASWRPWTEDTTRASPRRDTNYSHDISSSSSIQINFSQRRSHTPTTGNNARVSAVQTTSERRQPDRRQGSAANARNDGPSNIHPDLAQSHHAAPRSPERPLSMLRMPETLPQIDPAVREQLLAVVEAANPSIPDQSSDCPIRDHPLLSLSSLQSWLDLYFTQFNTAYPLIHLPTFSPSQIEPLLLLSIILLGATYSDKNAHQLAVCIHDVIRPSIFAHAGFSPRPELWTLQTILLVECFGKSRAGQKQHDMSHLFHGLLINLIRRSDCQSIANVPGPAQDAAAQEKAWRHWAEAEQKKRLALLCFMWDTQHAVLFCQSLCMSAFELRCAMPCSQSVWEAPDPEAWASAWQRSSSSPATSKPAVPLFLPMVKSYLTPTPGGSASHHDGINVLSLVLALHGLMSISWDMQRRDQTSLGVNSIIGSTTWKDLISKAYDRWKVDFDQYCQDAAAAAAESGEDKASEWATFAAAYGTIYHSAQALLYMDFLDIQIYAGARHILGRPVQQQDYFRSSKVVKRWAANGRERAATAAWHAARMLRDVMAPNIKTSQAESTGTRLADATHTSLFHVPWCLYLASLACWAFHHAKQGRKRVEEDDHNIDDSDGSDDEMVWDSQREMEALVVGMAGSGKAESSMRDILASQGRRGTNGLVWVVADVLSKVRWV
ncbi:Zinc finger protein klf1 [Cytospora mali]|uniref:Zinc finger protein klf1 n=1 Tax=Cytospora mali TaxID=578113 RepID=A0A194VPT5_CYTMA|nr:Zinc finger protein klf1 [Valsa mali]